MIKWTNKYHQDVVRILATSDEPWCQLSVDWQHGQIPVPGMEMKAETVRGVFEGLRLVGQSGRTSRYDVSLFRGPGRPRRIPDGEIQFGWYGGAGPSIGLIEAHHRILIPTYLAMLDSIPNVLQALHAKHEERGDIDLWDGIQNDNPLRPDPLSAAAILTATLNGSIEEWTRGGHWSMLS